MHPFWDTCFVIWFSVLFEYFFSHMLWLEKKCDLEQTIVRANQIARIANDFKISNKNVNSN